MIEASELTLSGELEDWFTGCIPDKDTAILTFNYIVRHLELLQLKENIAQCKSPSNKEYVSTIWNIVNFLRANIYSAHCFSKSVFISVVCVCVCLGFTIFAGLNVSKISLVE